MKIGRGGRLGPDRLTGSLSEARIDFVSPGTWLIVASAGLGAVAETCMEVDALLERSASVQWHECDY